MSSTPPVNLTDRRLLAAIVFTDVAGFTTRMETKEAATLALLERDFVTMRLFCTTHSGTVIKSTGDGLLLYFKSAVEAVNWALKTQRHLADQASRLPPNQILRHRIGIHLGEVFLGTDDIMGDGVNVAARVQAEAPPAGICISQVVYGVVKNKLKLDVVRLEPRKLKNINEAVQMYHVLLDPPRPAPPAPASPLPAIAKPESPSAFSGRNLALVGLAIVALGAAAALLYRAQLNHEKELAGSQELRAALGAALRSEPATATAEPAPAAPAAPVEIATTPPPAAGTEVDFLKLIASPPAGAAGTKERELALQQAPASIRILEAWRTAELRRYTRDSPLLVRPLRSPPYQSLTVFLDPDQRLTFAEGGAFRPRPWLELNSETQGAIITSLLSNSPVPIGHDVARGAEAFAFVHGLPEMAALLARP